MNKILIVDDEWNMRNLIRIYLSKQDLYIDDAKDGREALSMIKKTNYSLVILDIMMPAMDGWEVCTMIREQQNVPILMVTARNDVRDRVQGLNIGADDYLNKPFAPEELVARVNALLRRQNLNRVEKPKDSILSFDELSLDHESREVRVKDVPIELTPKEFELLYLVCSQPKRVFTREILLDQIWSSSDFRDVRTVDTHVKNIRVKLRSAGLTYNPIKTVWGVGYKLNAAEDQT